ncbi:MAG: hypothetical protein NTY53_04605 [Kiritimatiellaeota bacterium]|nr:hypothetical protein [Kiritimatiellota bacterium]
MRLKVSAITPGLVLLLAATAFAARPDRVPPPVLTTNDVDVRMLECLRVIARELAPDARQLQGKIKQTTAKTPGVAKRGLNIMVSRWDKGPQYALACLAVGEHVAEANAHIVRWCRDYPISKEQPQDAGDVDPRKILRAALLPETRARLTAETLAAIEEAAYAFVFKRSVIDQAAPPWNNASRTVWALSGSENHDANQKMANLLALQFLCLHGQRHNGETPLADGRSARAHYAAWVAYWKEYARQRAREGIFCEVAQPGSYGRATISVYFDLFDLADDPVLRRLGGDMATLHFAQLATEFEPRTGTRGAIAITRAKDGIDQQFGIHWTKNLTYAWGWHNAPDEKILEGESQIFTTHYRPPAIVTAIARDPRLPPYLATMRCPGLGGEKTNEVIEALFADGEAHNSHLRRTSWVTPEYMLSGLTTDPARHYLAISTQSRIAGITFASGVHDRLTIIGYDKPDTKSISYNAINALPWRDCVLAGRDPSGKTVATRIYVANALWSNRVEASNGWLFVRGGKGFCALRVASGGYAVSEAHHKMGVHLTLADKDAPLVFQTARAADIAGGFVGFQQAVQEKTRVEFAGNRLRYRSLAGDELCFWVKEPRLPEVNGQPFALNPPETYASPYLVMQHGTDVARIQFPGFKDLVLDFGYPR